MATRQEALSKRNSNNSRKAASMSIASDAPVGNTLQPRKNKGISQARTHEAHVEQTAPDATHEKDSVVIEIDHDNEQTNNHRVHAPTECRTCQFASNAHELQGAADGTKQARETGFGTVDYVKQRYSDIAPDDAVQAQHQPNNVQQESYDQTNIGATGGDNAAAPENEHGNHINPANCGEVPECEGVAQQVRQVNGTVSSGGYIDNAPTPAIHEGELNTRADPGTCAHALQVHHQDGLLEQGSYPVNDTHACAAPIHASDTPVPLHEEEHGEHAAAGDCAERQDLQGDGLLQEHQQQAGHNDTDADGTGPNVSASAADGTMLYTRGQKRRASMRSDDIANLPGKLQRLSKVIHESRLARDELAKAEHQCKVHKMCVTEKLHLLRQTFDSMYPRERYVAEEAISQLLQRNEDLDGAIDGYTNIINSFNSVLQQIEPSSG